MSILLEAKQIKKSYQGLEILKGVNLQLLKGQVSTLFGSSGAGKTTLLQVLGTLDQADSGEILFENIDIQKYTEKQQAKFRNEKLGFIFQFHHLLEECTAIENVSMPALIQGKSLKEAKPYAEFLLEKLNMTHRIHHKPSQLSGGEQQRVAVARALMNKPQLILADEPTGNLDSKNSHDLFNLFLSLASELNISFLIATHNEHFTSLSNQVLRIKDGII